MTAPGGVAHGTRWAERLQQLSGQVPEAGRLVVEGVLKRVVGLTFEAVGCQASVGSRCLVLAPDGNRVEAEVVGFSDDKLLLMPTGQVHGMMNDARVIPLPHASQICVGDALLGRVLDGAGRPLDGRDPLPRSHSVEITGAPINPLERLPIREPLDVGVRSINALTSVGRGQRMGLFAGSGVGKSMLLGMMTRYTAADVIVVALIGERGREVQEFIEETLGPDGLRRAVVVATPADHSPLMRLHGAWCATRIAEYFRDEGAEVLLLMDSLTRFAQAQREIALAVGEPPVTRGYPPSVFALLSQLVERAGRGGQERGSITGFYTVLTEADDQNDPIADAARAILDGHVVLSRPLAEAGIYPAVDIEASVSRVMTRITTPEHQRLVRRCRALYARYRENRDLISVGAYQLGSDPQVDEAIHYWPQILDFLSQDVSCAESAADSIAQLAALFAETPVPGAESASDGLEIMNDLQGAADA